MKNTLVMVADLGCLKAFRLENNNPNRTLRLELLEEFHNPEAHGKLVEKVTDLSGRFPRGSGAGDGGGAMSDGERHNIELESRRRLVRQLAQRFNQIAQNREVECCMVAASKEINRQLLEELDPQVRAKVQKNVSADLTKIEQSEILKHF